MANDVKCQSRKQLADDGTWDFIFGHSLCNDPNAAESLAHLMYSIREAIESGAEGASLASETLLDGIKFVYLYTDAYKAALKLYLLSLTGYLKPQDEPARLINGAIERAEAEVERAIADERKRKSRAKRKERS